MTCHNMKKNWKEKDGKGKRMLFTILVFIYLLQKSLNIYLINVEKKFKIKNHQSPTGRISIGIPLPECKRTLMYYLYILNCINKWYVMIFILLSYLFWTLNYQSPTDLISIRIELQECKRTLHMTCVPLHNGAATTVAEQT